MDSSEFLMGRLLGEGDFSKVFLCKKKDGTKGKYAMKVLKHSELGIKSYECETKKLSEVNHLNIIKWIKSEINGEHRCIITEYFPGKTLKYVIDSLKRPLTRDEILPIFTPLMSAITYLHRLKISHLDVDVVNIMIKFGKSKKIEAVKLIDFGLPDSAIFPLWGFTGDCRELDIHMSAIVLLEMLYGTTSREFMTEKLKLLELQPEQIVFTLIEISHFFRKLICGMLLRLPQRFTSYKVLCLLEENI